MTPLGMFMSTMKNRIGLIVLVVACVALLLGLVMVWKQGSDQHSKDTEMVSDYSNRWVKTSGTLDEQKQVAALLEKDLDTQKKAYVELTNNFTQVSANLAKTSDDLTKTNEALQSSLQELAKRETKISELETQNQQLDKQAADLTTSLTNLTIQIDSTQRKLAASEGDKAFLEKELKRLIVEKTELERQFNDLSVLRAQVSKLKEELNIARRIEWIRQGIFANAEQKGAQKLMQGASAPQMAARTAKPAYDLNVEVNADGSVKVIPPLAGGGPTNSPPAR
jgi:chromosome segregation ATPase